MTMYGQLKLAGLDNYFAAGDSKYIKADGTDFKERKPSFIENHGPLLGGLAGAGLGGLTAHSLADNPPHPLAPGLFGATVGGIMGSVGGEVLSDYLYNKRDEADFKDLEGGRWDPGTPLKEKNFNVYKGILAGGPKDFRGKVYYPYLSEAMPKDEHNLFNDEISNDRVKELSAHLNSKKYDSKGLSAMEEVWGRGPHKKDLKELGRMFKFYGDQGAKLHSDF